MKLRPSTTTGNVLVPAFSLSLILILGSPLPGCGRVEPSLGSGESTQIIKGHDSAGATIELTQQGSRFTTARVIDIALGTGESQVVTAADGSLDFTIAFPGGVTITYQGEPFAGEIASEVVISGTWQQHATGLFGEDSGTWQVAHLQ